MAAWGTDLGAASGRASRPSGEGSGEPGAGASSGAGTGLGAAGGPVGSGPPERCQRLYLTVRTELAHARPPLAVAIVRICVEVFQHIKVGAM